MNRENVDLLGMITKKYIRDIFKEDVIKFMDIM